MQPFIDNRDLEFKKYFQVKCCAHLLHVDVGSPIAHVAHAAVMLMLKLKLGFLINDLDVFKSLLD